MARKKSTPSLKQQMAEHIDDYGWCRANMHIWQHPSSRNGAIVVEPHGILLIVYKCHTCQCKRHDRVSRSTGELVYRYYEHAPGYLMKLEGSTKPNKSDWRKVHFNHLLGG